MGNSFTLASPSPWKKKENFLACPPSSSNSASSDSSCSFASYVKSYSFCWFRKRIFCQTIHTINTASVVGMVAARKYHHRSETRNCRFPSGSGEILKKTMLKIAWATISKWIAIDKNIVWRIKVRIENLVLTDMNVPGRKNIVTAAIVIMDELSRWASLAIAVVALEISTLSSLSTWVERWNAFDV